MTPDEGPQEQTQDSQEQGDPIQALGGALDSFVQGVQGSNLPDDVKKQAQAVMDSFQQLVSMIGGGGGGGSQPAANASQMAGANPNAQMVR